jgi:hypothetical protein
MRSVALVLLAGLLLGADLDPAPVACHGLLDGERFWMRLGAADRSLGGNRLWQVVWTPPAPTVVDGAHLGDVPFILLDPQGLTVAHNARSTLGRVLPTATGAYRIVREIQVGGGDDARPAEETRHDRGPRAWDLRLAPLHLALAWRADGSGEARVVDFFGPRLGEDLRIRWDGTRVDLAGTLLTARAGADGRLAALDGPGTALVIQGWLPAP